MIETTAIHHVSLTVVNVEEAKVFYRDVLKLKELPRPNFDFEGAWFAVGAQQLHLIIDPGHTINLERTINTRAPHFALRVIDYYETVKWLQQNKIDIVEKPDSRSGFAQIFCLDPSGNTIELNVDQNDLR
ncbi:VOC family protein [Halalkalibacter urbisdiaboli]|uniref:VOC family protein n=1 Tax=Halalkalibacter urbisdiaboli TaxID=1960589 RepID=UPI000B44D74B|nr:VOC family protein [Halalkalibacter urbisdiaboli]